MSIEREITIPTHPNIYTGYSTRSVKVYVSEPSQGINSETGFCLLVAGYGGQANSNVYKKMRTTFADHYNLVSIQCDYFGYEFMQGSSSRRYDVDFEYIRKYFKPDELSYTFEGGVLHADRFESTAQNYDMMVNAYEDMKESLNNYNDMGILQALDNLTALLYVMKEMGRRGLHPNSKKVIAYGHSHGAYLCHLCNAFAPNLFSLMIDNSAWIIPNYLTSTRDFAGQIGSLIINLSFDYLARTLPYDFELLCLPLLYQKFANECKILCFHGSSDAMVLPRQKKSFCSFVPNCLYFEVGVEQVDGYIFKSTGHCMDADFIKLFDFVVSRQEFQIGNDVVLPNVVIETQQKRYEVTYDNYVPLLLSHTKA